MSKRAIINLTTDGIILSNVGAAINTNPLLWAVIDKTEFFSQFAMEGVDERNNEIWLNAYPGQSHRTIEKLSQNLFSFFYISQSNWQQR